MDQSARKLGPLPNAPFVGGIVAAAAAGVLILLMFLPWYGAPSFGFGDIDLDANAWEAFEGMDIILVLLTLGVIGTALVVVLRDQLQVGTTAVFILSIVCAGAAGLLAILVLVKLASPPGGTSAEVGAVLAFVAALVAAAGAALALIPAIREWSAPRPAAASPADPSAPAPPFAPAPPGVAQPPGMPPAPPPPPTAAPPSPPAPAAGPPPPPPAAAPSPPPAPTVPPPAAPPPIPAPPQPTAPPPPPPPPVTPPPAPVTQPVPGWYPDPAGSGGLRYWDGARWTEHTG